MKSSDRRNGQGVRKRKTGNQW